MSLSVPNMYIILQVNGQFVHSTCKDTVNGYMLLFHTKLNIFELNKGIIIYTENANLSKKYVLKIRRMSRLAQLYVA